jgi:galactokinase
LFTLLAFSSRRKAAQTVIKMSETAKKRPQSQEEYVLTRKMFNRELNGIDVTHRTGLGGAGAGGGSMPKSRAALREIIPPMPKSKRRLQHVAAEQAKAVNAQKAEQEMREMEAIAK